MGGLTRDRAQILLIGGLLLAVAILTLAVVFNSAVYSSTMAGQAERDVSEHPARSLQEDVRTSVRDLVRRAVRAHPNDRSAQVRYVRENISAIERNMQRYAAESEAIVNVSWNGTFDDITPNTNGWHLENTSGRLYNATGAQNWSIGSANRIRNFEVNLTRTYAGADRHFIVNFSGDDGNWYQVRFRQTNVTAVSPDVRVYNSNRNPRGRCEIELENPGDPYYLHADFTNATLNGEYCNAMDFFAHLEPPYGISFERGQLVQDGATFSLTTDDGTQRSDGAVGQSYADAGAAARWPEDWYRRLYGVLIDVEYYGPDVSYNATIAVAPGEPS